MAAVNAPPQVANGSLGSISGAQTSAIAAAGEAFHGGTALEHLVVDLLEGSGGTSLNMKCKRGVGQSGALLLGHAAGHYEHLHPNEHVNRSQSTNTVPSAILMTCYHEIGQLMIALRALRDSVDRKAREFAEIPRLGRTCLQDAQPMTLGQAFSAYECVIARAIASIAGRREVCLDLPLGGTAVGTGLGACVGMGRNVRLMHSFARPMFPGEASLTYLTAWRMPMGMPACREIFAPSP